MNDARGPEDSTRARLLAVQRQAKLAYWYLPRQGGRIEWSENAGSVLGLADGDLPVDGEAYLNRIHPEDRAAARAAYAQVRERPGRYEVDYRVVSAGGVVLWIHEAGDVVAGPDGRLTAESGTIQDVTMQKRAEDAHRASEALLKSVMAAVPVMIQVKDREGRYVMGNKPPTRTMDPGVQYIGRTFSDLSSDKAFAAWVEALDRQVIETERGTGFVVEPRLDPNVQEDWIASKTPVFDASGHLTHIVTVAIDVTDQKRAEEEARRGRAVLRSIIDAIPAVICARDREGRYTLINAYEAELLGLTPDQAIGRTPEELTPGLDPIWRETDLKVLETGEALEPYQVRGSGAGHEGRTWMVVKTPLRDERGVVDQVVIVGLDVTERERLQDRLRDGQRLQAIGQLTGGVAHDFNNLLAVILGNLELARERIGDSDLGDLVGTAFRAAERAADLTRRLLAFGRRQALAPRTVDVNALIAGMTALVAGALGETVELELSLDPGAWPATIDPGQLETAIMNLAMNARDAMPGGGRLTIATRNARRDAGEVPEGVELEAGRYVEVTVADNGTGIAPDILHRVFEPFFTTKEVGKGTGLGLSMVYGFIKQSGGHVTLESVPGEGTAARLFLPAARAETAQPAGDDTPRARTGEAVLVVEDNAGIQVLAKRLLEDLGYVATIAPTAREGLRMLESGARIDLLLTDVVLPQGMSGIELYDAMPKNRAGLPVLFMSGYADGAPDGTLRPELADRIMRKPFRRAELARRVRDAIDGADRG